MRSRTIAALICLGCLGSDPAKTGPAPSVGPAVQAWERGQRAMLAGDSEGAVALYRESLRLDPELTRNYLSLSAVYLEKGDEAAAADHMGEYLRRQPEHYIVRVHYAELLLRLGRPREASEHFERFVADVQSRPELAEEHLIHCHSKLMEIAEGQEDEYGEHLHRGIGLYLLARQRQLLGEGGAEMSAEGMLCKAAGELAMAIHGRPAEARPCWYLSAVWTELAQRRPAARWLHAAREAAPFSYMTPAERDALRLACRQEEERARTR
jgi:tetratricopeptide (TPR) repeat protein